MRFEQQQEREELLLVIANLLHKGMHRLKKDTLHMLDKHVPTDYDLLMASARSVFDSLEDFWLSLIHI